MKKILTVAVMMVLCIAAYAHPWHVVLTKDNVNLREEPSTSAPVVKKGHKGALLELVDQKPGWFQVKSLEGDGETVWVAASVSKKMDYTYSDEEDFTTGFVGYGIYGPEFGVTKDSANSSEEEKWVLSTKSEKFAEAPSTVRTVHAVNIWSMANVNGFARYYEHNYRGKCYPTHFVFDEVSEDGGDTYEKMDTPIYVYPSMTSIPSLFVNGVQFQGLDMGTGNDDDWG